MPVDVQTVRDAALQLSEQDRILLVGDILESLPAEAMLTDDELYAELQRRVTEGMTDGIPWEQVREMR
uniref:Addiction module protein n=1 Tax=Schlesneria paludicola TaxID=360056 RepID=A0A7C2NUT7_9PLAN